MKNRDLDKIFPDERSKKKDKLDKLKEIELRMLKVFDYICKKNKIDYSLAFGTLLGAVRHKGFIPWDDDLDVIMTRKDFNYFLKHVDELPKSIFFQTKENDDIEWGRAFLAKLKDNNSKVQFDVSHHPGAFIDIFLLDRISSNKFIAGIQKMCLILMKLFYVIEKEDVFKDRGRFFKLFLKKIILFPKKILNKLDFSNFLERVYSKIFKEKDGDNYCIHFMWFKFLILREKDVFPMRKMKFEGKFFPCLKNYKKYFNYLYEDYRVLPKEEDRIPKHFDIEKIIV